MYLETKDLLAQASQKKATFLKKYPLRYLISSAWAGSYVGIGIILIMVIGSFGTAAESTFTKAYMGLAFGIALSLVIMIGSELFTGNNLIMTVGALDRKVTWLDALKVWGLSYVGNFIGSFVIGALFVMATSGDSAVSEFIVKTSAAKMNDDFFMLLAKGILCNLLVCLAVLASVKMKSESGKLIMIFWCLFAFITSGFEHSIANMTIFSMGLLFPHTEMVSVAGMAANLIPVTLGNFIGGAMMLGVSYFYMGNTKE